MIKNAENTPSHTNNIYDSSKYSHHSIYQYTRLTLLSNQP
jgi:hypothetical protein